MEAKEEKRLSTYMIQVESDHPDADHLVASGADSIAEELAREGSRAFKVVLVNESGQPLTTWASEG